MRAISLSFINRPSVYFITKLYISTQQTSRRTYQAKINLLKKIRVWRNETYLSLKDQPQKLLASAVGTRDERFYAYPSWRKRSSHRYYGSKLPPQNKRKQDRPSRNISINGKKYRRKRIGDLLLWRGRARAILGECETVDADLSGWSSNSSTAGNTIETETGEADEP
jgi:hypothetical protein